MSSVLNEQKLTLQFNNVLSFDLADAKVAAPPNIASISQRADVESSAVDIVLIGEVDVHSFREEKNYVIDVAFQQAEKTALPEQQAAAAPNAPPNILAKPLPAARASRDRRLKEAMPPQQPAELPPVTSELIAEQARIEIKPGQATEAPERMPAATETATPAADKATPATRTQRPRQGRWRLRRQAHRRRKPRRTAQPAEPMQAAAAEAPKPLAPGQAPAPVEAAKPATPAISAPRWKAVQRTRPPPSRRGATATPCA